MGIARWGEETRDATAEFSPTALQQCPALPNEGFCMNEPAGCPVPPTPCPRDTVESIHQLPGFVRS